VTPPACARLAYESRTLCETGSHTDAPASEAGGDNDNDNDNGVEANGNGGESER
jgi:hypothetical protein